MISETNFYELHHRARLAIKPGMDFLMLFSESQRVVIEIDGVQHYAEYVKGNKKHYASVA